ncbi:MAG: CinA family protein, partial [Firmicutes bacterium]|nr:CinA family protein [Bacillota bacterium]
EMIKNPGSSKVIPGSIVAYNNEQKMKLLNLSENEFEKYSVVSERIARLMATSIRALMKTDIGVSVTGNAGPGIQENTDKVEAWIAIDYQGDITAYNLEFSDFTRLQAMRNTVRFTYEKLSERL